MAHDTDIETRIHNADLRLEEAGPIAGAEVRSWEPPCWPSDEYGAPSIVQRAIGWRGAARFLPFGALRH